MPFLSTLQIKTIFIIILYGVICAAQVHPSNPSQNSKTLPTLSRSQWIEKLDKQLANKLCETDSVFEKCYQVNKPTCRQAISQSMEKCVAAARAPASIDSSTLEPKLNFKVGACVARDYQKKFHEVANNNGDCRPEGR